MVWGGFALQAQSRRVWEAAPTSQKIRKKSISPLILAGGRCPSDRPTKRLSAAFDQGGQTGSPRSNAFFFGATDDTGAANDRPKMVRKRLEMIQKLKIPPPPPKKKKKLFFFFPCVWGRGSKGSKKSHQRCFCHPRSDIWTRLEITDSFFFSRSSAQGGGKEEEARARYRQARARREAFSGITTGGG